MRSSSLKPGCQAVFGPFKLGASEPSPSVHCRHEITASRNFAECPYIVFRDGVLNGGAQLTARRKAAGPQHAEQAARRA